MPVRKVSGGYQWGNHGKVYRSKAKAEAQGRAAYANGYQGDARKGDKSDALEIIDAIVGMRPDLTSKK